MDDEAVVGIAPLVTGLSLLGTTNPSVLTATTNWTSTEFLYTLTGTVGGVAAVVVGIGILRGWNGFASAGGSSRTTNIAVVGAAVVAFYAGSVLTAV